jgi:hypothetical protein
MLFHRHLGVFPKLHRFFHKHPWLFISIFGIFSKLLRLFHILGFFESCLGFFISILGFS